MTDDVVVRYRANFRLADAAVTRQQVGFHLQLERELTAELMASTPADRWDVFERVYSTFYEQLPWLIEIDPRADVARWSKLIGPAPRTVYEVGSGHGDLARGLAGVGYDVTATDVSRERGGEREQVKRLRWSVTDGVHLADHAPAGEFDAVISDQLIEHLHPDDVHAHFDGARLLLRAGGRYVFRTPHALHRTARCQPRRPSPEAVRDAPQGVHLHRAGRHRSQCRLSAGSLRRDRIRRRAAHPG